MAYDSYPKVYDEVENEIVERGVLRQDIFPASNLRDELHLDEDALRVVVKNLDFKFFPNQDNSYDLSSLETTETVSELARGYADLLGV